MSESITPQLREEVLARLRSVTLVRSFKKTPEEIERLLLEKARGVKKSYLDLLSRVLSPATIASASAGAHGASPGSATQPASAAMHPRSGSTNVQAQQPRMQHHMPANTTPIGMRPRTHPVASQGLQFQTLQHQVYPAPGGQSIQPSQALSVVTTVSRTLQSTASTPNLSMQGLTVSTQGQTPVIYQQTGIPSGMGDKTVLVHPITTQKIQLSAQQLPSAGSQLVHHQGDNIIRFTTRRIAGSNTPVLIRTASNGSVPTGVSSEDAGSASNTSTPGKPAITVLSAGQGKVVRPNLQTVQHSKPSLSSNLASQSAPNVSAIASRSHSSDRSTGHRPEGASTRVSSTPSKPPQEPHPPEVQAQIVSRLTAMAAKYLPAVRQGIQMVSAQPETQQYVRKYIKLRDILENPKANLNVIRLAQVQPIERLLDEIERNPMHLVQQQQQHQHAQQQPKRAAAAAAAASAAAAAAATASSLQHKPTTPDSGVRKSVPVQLPSRQDTATMEPVQKQQQLQRSTTGPYSQQAGTVTEQSQSRFKIATTNLNTLLSQPLGSASPLNTTEQHTGHSRQASQVSPSNRTLFVSTSPDVGTTTIPNAPASHLSTHPSAESGCARPGFPFGMEGHFSRLGHGGLGPFSSQPRTSGMSAGGFQTNLQVLAAELQRIAERASQDAVYGRRVCRVINEISEETKAFRQAYGLLLPQDLYQAEVNKAKDEPIDKIEEIELQPVRPRSRKRDRTPGMDVEPVDGADNTDEASEAANKPVEPKEKKLRLEVSISENEAASSTEEEHVGAYASRTYPPLPKIAPFHNALPDYSDSLFVKVTIPYDTESSPMEVFDSDQIERLNPRILRELQRIQEFHIRVESNPKPPSIDLMETYATCMNSGEWNTSCHLKLSQDDENLNYLPCAPPALFIRIAPDYLRTAHLNWYYAPRSESIVQNRSDQYSVNECERFLDLCYSELDKVVQKQLRRVTHYRLSLYLVAKSWMDCICSAMARFVKLDENIFLAA